MDKKTKKINKKTIDVNIKKKKNEDSDIKAYKSSEIVSSNKNEQSSKRKFNEDSKLDELVPQLEKKKKKLKKSKVAVEEKKVPNKKIFFNDADEESCEVANTAEPTITKKKNKAKFLNEDEADVKEEDIDQFCDDITEEDNQQYEDWVKLIEAKLHSNKKSK